MKRLIAILICGLMLSLVACQPGAEGIAGGNVILMNAANFQGNRNLTITAGQSVTFDDPAASGGNHFLFTGIDGQYMPMAGAPPDLENPSGLKLTAGTKMTEVFSKPGTYTITCLIHQAMLATITVH
jgi:plastocyanin